MNDIITHIDLDFYSPTYYEVIKAQQNDTNRYIQITLKNSGEDYQMDDIDNIKFMGSRSDSTSFSIDKNNGVTWNDNVVLVNIAEAITVAGISTAKIVLVGSNNQNKITSTIPFRISIQAAFSSADPSPSPGGSTVTITPTLYDGVKIANYKIDGVNGELFAPEGSQTSIKTKTWVGNGSTSLSITFSEIPSYIVSIDGTGSNNDYINLSGFRYGSSRCNGFYIGSSSGILYDYITYSVDELTMTITGQDAESACNSNGQEYTMLYL